jgi:hypothetical protein
MIKFTRPVFLLFALFMFGAAVSAQGPDTGPDVTVDAAVKTATITKLAKGLREAYVDPDAGEKAAAMLETHLAQKDYESITSGRAFAELLTKQMSEVAHDKHLRVRFSSAVLSVYGTLPGSSEPFAVDQKKRNYDFVKVERLNGNIGYLRVDGFMDTDGAGQVAAGAMSFLANTDGLIIDLRYNGGGRPDMVALLSSYFFAADAHVHLTDIATRIDGTKNFEMREFWSEAKLPAERYLNREIYILTSPRTFSGGEGFAYQLQALKRATIVGETTGGGANPGGPYGLSDHFVAFMPRGRAVNPITKTNWEGVGVAPDVKVAQADALNTAQALALKHLMAKTTDQKELATLQLALAAAGGGSGSAPMAQSAPAATTSAPVAPGSVDGVAGLWVGEIIDPGGNKHKLTFDLKTEGGKISGTITGGPPAGAVQPVIKGTLAGDQLTLEVTIPDPDGNPVPASFTGKIAGSDLVGQLRSQFGDLQFTVTRK